MKLLTLVWISTFCISGCSALRYDLGFRAGQKAYEEEKKYGTVKDGYGIGYMQGWTFFKSMDNLDESLKKTQEILKKWDEHKGEHKLEKPMEDEIHMKAYPLKVE